MVTAHAPQIVSWVVTKMVAVSVPVIAQDHAIRVQVRVLVPQHVQGHAI